MATRPPGEVIVARLRAHKMLPPGAPARVVRAGRYWAVADPASGRDYRLGSYVPAKAVAAARRWRFRSEGGVTLVEPDSEQGIVAGEPVIARRRTEDGS
jgi:hypothetical protein